MDELTDTGNIVVVVGWGWGMVELMREWGRRLVGMIGWAKGKAVMKCTWSLVACRPWIRIHALLVS